MPILNKKNQQEVQKYIEFVSHYKNSHYYQDYRWSSVKNNLECECVYIEEAGKIVAACTVYVRPIIFGLSILYAQRGPVCDLQKPEMVMRLIDEMKPLIKKYHAFMIKFDPNVQDSETLVNVYKKLGFKIRGKGYTKLDLILSRRSMVIHINGETVDELLPRFKSKTRYNIRKSLKNHLEVIEDFSDDKIDIFMELLKITAVRDGIEYKPREFFVNIRDSFTHDEARLFLIKHEDDYLSGALAVNYAGRMMYYHGASSNEKRNLFPNYLMQYAMIQWACESGCHIYDMGGIIKEDNEDGLYRFKSGFCEGNVMDEYIGEMDYPLNSFLYWGFIISYKLMQRIRRAAVQREIKKQQAQKNN